jgi:NAD(P)-dependent dehydrogenase (short-subunit alcohol dehydrogenase family)
VVGDDPRHAILELDLAAVSDVEACVDRAADALAGLDGFVACAGIAEHAPIGAIDGAALRRQLAINVEAPLLMAQRAAHHLADAGGGAMLLVASTLALQPAPMTAAYAASKAALVSIARSLALELGPRSIRVNALAPGVVDTDMVHALRLAPGQPVPASAQERERLLAGQLEELRKIHPLGRLGIPEDVAETALYVLAAPYVSGTVVVVDGGLTLGSGKP